MTKILLTRHGHVEGIDPPRFRGRANIPLTARGREQAQALAKRIAKEWKPAVIYSSPLVRCMDTGKAIAVAAGCPLNESGDLSDFDYGDLQWKTWDEVKRDQPVLFHKWFNVPHLAQFPGGESLQSVVARTARALRFAIERHPKETVVLVGHDSVNRALLLQLLDQPLSAFWRLKQSPCSINEIEVDGDRIAIQRINDASHLDE